MRFYNYYKRNISLHMESENDYVSRYNQFFNEHYSKNVVFTAPQQSYADRFRSLLTLNGIPFSFITGERLIDEAIFSKASATLEPYISSTDHVFLVNKKEMDYLNLLLTEEEGNNPANFNADVLVIFGINR